MKNKIILIIICIIVTYITIRLDKIYNYFANEKYYNSLVRLHLIKKCYNPGRNFEEIFSQENLNYQKLNKEAIDNALNKLSNLSTNNNYKIPPITHKIYFTPKNQHITLDDFYIEEMRINYNKLNGLQINWQHNIWVNQIDLIPEDIKNIKGVEIKSIDEFQSHPSYNTLLNLLDRGKNLKAYLAQASDLFRLMAVQKLGGIYSDMDYEIYNPKALLQLIENFDFIGAREHWGINSYYGNAFIAAKPDHPILNEALKNSLRNHNLENHDSTVPDYVQYSCNISDTLYFNGPPLITIAYFNKNNIDGNNDIILPPWMIFNFSFITYKNQTCDISNITKDFLFKQEENLDQLLESFVINPIIVESQQHDLSISSKINSNIFYNLKDKNKFPIIGADMFCGSWTDNREILKKHYYWNIP